LVQDRDGAWFQTAGILWYVEDLKPGANKGIGPKDFFETGSRLKAEEQRLKTEDVLSIGSLAHTHEGIDKQSIKPAGTPSLSFFLTFHFPTLL
jgi:hypothetical protein